MPETAAYLGTKIVLTKEDGSILSDVYVIGEGLCSDQTATVTFGLGTDPTIKSINLYLPNGTTRMISDYQINRVNRI